MKKLLFAVITLFAISMLAPSSGTAEPTHPNEIGLYTTPDGYGATGTYEINVPVDVYLVLTRPTDVENNNEPYSTINFFECQLNFNPIGDIFMVEEVLPPDNVEIGDNDHISDGYLEYIVGIPYTNPLIVTDESVVLIHFQFIAIGVIEVTLSPTSYQEIPGQMAFSWLDYDPQVMYSMGGSHDCPVFIFGGEAVPVEQESFGSVKALYR